MLCCSECDRHFMGYRGSWGWELTCQECADKMGDITLSADANPSSGDDSRCDHGGRDDEETFTCFLCGWDNFGPPELLEEELICKSCKANIEEIEDIEGAPGRN